MPPQEEHDLCEKAQAALEQGDLHAAADLCKELLVQYPQSARGYHITAALFKATGNYRKARDYSSIAAELDSLGVQYHLQQGQMLYLLKEYGDAEKAFQRACAIAPNHSEACRWLGNCLAALERFEEARSCFARASSLAPHRDLRMDEARCDMQSGNVASAEKLLADYLHDHPADASAMVSTATLAITQGEFTRAETLLHKAVAADGKNVEARFYLALMLAEAGDEHPAIVHLLSGLQAEPTHLPSLLMLGGIFLKAGDFEASEKAFTHVIALAPRPHPCMV